MVAQLAVVLGAHKGRPYEFGPPTNLVYRFRPRGAGSGAMIKRVFIKGYKSFIDLDLALSPLTVIVGANASGKSNLLDALGLLSRMASGPSIAAAFDDHRGVPLESFTMPTGGIEELMRRETLRMSLGADVELSKRAVSKAEEIIGSLQNGSPPAGSNGAVAGLVAERHLRYSLDIAFSTRTGELRVENESLIALGPDGRPKREVPPFIGWDAASERLTLRSEGDSRSMRYEPGMDRAIASIPAYPPHYSTATAFREELRRWRFYSLNPDAMRENAPLRVADSVSPDGRGLAGFYHTLKTQTPEQFQGVSAALPFAIPNSESIETELTSDGMVRLAYRDDGINHSPKVVSDGTLRALGLFAILSPFNDATVVGLEEPEVGVHPRRLGIIARLLENAVLRNPDIQILTTTHSPRLPDLLRPDYSALAQRVSLLACSKRNHKARIENVFDNPLFAQTEVESAWEESIDDDPVTVEEVMIRGDYGG